MLRERESRGVSAALHGSLREGDTLPVSGPRNNFPLVDAERYVFIAGGIGITPLLPMIDAAAASGREWQLHYATRGAVAPFESRLSGRACSGTIPASGDSTSPRCSARIEPGTAVYCCGPERMLDEAVELAELHGIDLHIERFTGVEAVRAGDREFEVELARGDRFTVPADRSILSVLQDPASRCSPPAAKATAGRARHACSPAPSSTGTCCSPPRSATPAIG